MAVTPEQFRAARSLVRMPAADLAALANVSRRTVHRLESARGRMPGRYEEVMAIQEALEASGVVFGPGMSVSLKEARS